MQPVVTRHAGEANPVQESALAPPAGCAKLYGVLTQDQAEQSNNGLKQPRLPRWVRIAVIGRNPKVTLARVAILIVTSFVVFKFILLPIRVEGISMLPNYKDWQQDEFENHETGDNTKWQRAPGTSWDCVRLPRYAPTAAIAAASSRYSIVPPGMCHTP